MKKMNFPTIPKNLQQSLYGAWGGSNSDRDDTYYGGSLGEVVITGSGGGGGGNTGGDFGGGWWNDPGYSEPSNPGYSGGGGFGDVDGQGDPITLEGLPAMGQQIGNMCTFEAVHFVTEYLGDDLTVGEIALWSTQDSGDLGNIQDGLSLEELEDLIEHFVDEVEQMNTHDEIQDAIDDGNMVVSTMVNGDDGHAVVITGYDPETGQYQFADPQTGTTGNWADYDNFSWSWEVSNSSSTGNNGGVPGYTPGDDDDDYDYREDDYR